MKPAPLLFACSLAANVALAVLLAMRLATPAVSSAVTIAPTTRSALTPPAQIADPKTWRRLDATEPVDFVARLRAEGFPPAIIRAMARVLVREHFRDRYQALAEAEAAKPYWRRGGPFGDDPKIVAVHRALEREAAEMLQQLLGPAALQPTPDQLAWFQRRYGNLPTDKLVQVQKIVSDYNDLVSEVRDTAGEIMLPGDRAKLALLQKEREADIARLLTPDEVVEYELHHSSTANQLLQQLSAFDPTEEEFRALFTLNRAIDATYGRPGVLSPEQRLERTAAQKALAAQIAAALGPARYAEYQQATDPTYQQVFQLTSQLGLPRTAAAEVVAVQKDIQQRGTAVRVDNTLTLDQRTAQLAALHQEATARLTTSLGAAGLEVYKNGSGYWLQNFQRAPKAAPKQ